MLQQPFRCSFIWQKPGMTAQEIDCHFRTEAHLRNANQLVMEMLFYVKKRSNYGGSTPLPKCRRLSGLISNED